MIGPKTGFPDPPWPSPARNLDPDFDKMADAMWETLVKTGNPEKISEEAARDMLARRLAEQGVKTFSDPPEPDWDLPPDEPDQQVAEVVLRIPSPQGEPYWWDDPSDHRLMRHFVAARRALGRRFTGGLLITGPSGAGKTDGVRHLFRELDLPLLVMNCATVTDPQKWFGRREVDADGTHYVESDFLTAIRSGHGILLDELPRLHPTLLNPIYGLLDGSQELRLSDMNLTVPVHDQTVFFATANQGAQFTGNHRLDWAARERFPFTIERPFPPMNEEIKIMVSATGVDEDAASVLADLGFISRTKFANGDLRAPISTRMLVQAAWLVASGYSEREAAEYSIVALYDPLADGTAGEQSERSLIRGIIDGRLGKRK